MLVIDCFAVFVCVVCALDMHACKAFSKHDIEMGYLLFVNIALKWNVSCVIVPKGEISISRPITTIAQIPLLPYIVWSKIINYFIFSRYSFGLHFLITNHIIFTMHASKIHLEKIYSGCVWMEVFE